MNILIYQNSEYKYFLDEYSIGILVRDKYNAAYHFTLNSWKNLDAHCKCLDCLSIIEHTDSQKVYHLAKKYYNLL